MVSILIILLSLIWSSFTLRPLIAPRQNSRVMSDRETSAENQSIETEVAADEAVEETKKRAILGDADDAKEETVANHVNNDDVEKGSMENCDDAKEDDGVEDGGLTRDVAKEDDRVEDGGLPGDDALIFDMKRSSPSQSSPPPSSPPPSKKSSTVESSSQEADVSKQIYHVKWIGWHDTRCPIIMQNVNGPCPLISITNVLLLRGKMSLDEGVEVVSSESLIANIGELY